MMGHVANQWRKSSSTRPAGIWHRVTGTKQFRPHAENGTTSRYQTPIGTDGYAHDAHQHLVEDQQLEYERVLLDSVGQYDMLSTRIIVEPSKGS